MNQLDQVTQQNAALVEERAAAADGQSQQAARLGDALGVFRLEVGQAGHRASATPHAARQHAHCGYLTFRLGAEEYGIDIPMVQEIRPY